MKSPKEVRPRSSAKPEFGLKGCICHAILNEGERLFQSTAYVYIYIWKVDKGVAEIKFCYPTLACEESGKACEESSEVPFENTSKPPFWKRIFGKKDFLLF